MITAPQVSFALKLVLTKRKGSLFYLQGMPGILLFLLKLFELGLNILYVRLGSYVGQPVFCRVNTQQDLVFADECAFLKLRVNLHHLAPHLSDSIPGLARLHCTVAHGTGHNGPFRGGDDPHGQRSFPNL